MRPSPITSRPTAVSDQTRGRRLRRRRRTPLRQGRRREGGDRRGHRHRGAQTRQGAHRKLNQALMRSAPTASTMRSRRSTSRWTSTATDHAGLRSSQRGPRGPAARAPWTGACAFLSESVRHGCPDRILPSLLAGAWVTLKVAFDVGAARAGDRPDRAACKLSGSLPLRLWTMLYDGDARCPIW